jgi:type III pantothenate kinase
VILCIDIGNTNIGWGVFENNTLRVSWRSATNREKTADEWGLEALQFFSHFQLSSKEIKALLVSSVVPPLNFPFKEMGKRYFHLEPLFAGENLKIPMPILTDHPTEVGADLLIGAYSAFRQYSAPVIVVDFGTATTFSAVSPKGEFLGTAIAPGIAISAEALFSKAARLPRIQIKKPPAPIGKNTIHSMQSGFLYGFAGQAEKIIQLMKKELGEKTVVVATGGLADLVAHETKEIHHVDPDLILKGLNWLHHETR